MTSRLLTALVAALALAACGKSSPKSNFLYEAARQTTPVIAPGGSTTAVTAPAAPILAAWTFGDPAFEVFTMLRDYDPERDTGRTVGLDNLYKSLWQTGAFYDEYRPRCAPIPLAVIASPFDLGNDVAYDCAVNDQAAKHGHASREPAGQKLGLNSWRVDYPDGQSELGVQQASFGTASQDLVVDEAVWVRIPTATDFSMRYHIEGNAQTHQFSTKLLKYTAGGYWISVVGQGVSKGAGNHFLFKASDQGGLTGGYLCSPADVSEAQLKLIPWTSGAAVDAACAPYQAAVDALTPLVAPADVPTSAASFAGSSIYLAF